MDTAGNRIRELRIAKGLSLQQMADRVGASKPQIDKLEKGTRRLTDDWIRRVADALSVPPEEILQGPAGRIPASTAPETAGYAPPPSDTDQDTGPDTVPGSVDTEAKSVSNSVSDLDTTSSVDTEIPLVGYGRFVPAEGRQIGILADIRHAPERVWRPAPLAGLATAYAVRMPDGSMVPKYEPGQVLFVHPYRTPRLGDAVVVRLAGQRFLVGRLVGIGDRGVTLERLDPAGHQLIGRDQVVAVERIVLAEEP